VIVKKRLKTYHQTKKITAIICIITLLTTIPLINATMIYTLSCRTDHSEYYPGETVKISGYLKNDGNGVNDASVCVEIVYAGETVISLCIQTSSSGYYSMIYTANGLGYYSVKAEAHDYGLTAYDSFKVVSTSVTANANGPYYGVVGQPIQFNGSVDGGKSPHTWLWIFGDGTNTSSDKDPTYVYYAIGNYTVSLTVRDDGGHEDADQTTITITNELIADANGPYGGPPNISISFKGLAYGGYSPYSYEWDFGDGNSSNEQNPDHIYSLLGSYNINLTVTDAKDIQTTDSTTVYVAENYPPNKPSIPKGTTNGKANTEYTYSSDTTDPNQNQIYYLWDWGDGNTSGWLGPYESGVIVNASYKWIEKGDYEIKVKAKDIYEAESEWSDPLPISMPKNRNMPFLRFLENHPYIFLLFRQLLGL